MGRDWNEFFTKKDFADEFLQIGSAEAHETAQKANALIREELERAVKVYGFIHDGDEFWGTVKDYGGRDTLEARLVCVKKIEGE